MAYHVAQQCSGLQSRGSGRLLDLLIELRCDVEGKMADRVVNEIGLSGCVSSDPAPDILAVALGGPWIFISLRGLTPLRINASGVHNAVGSMPVVGVFCVDPDGPKLGIR
jgi:hypothetical protein